MAYVFIWSFAILLFPLLLFCLEVVVGCFRYAIARRATESLRIVPALDQTLKGVVLVPAHNEHSVIGATLESLLSACSQNMRIIVIADNCSDDTAVIARQYHCEVIERTHAQDRGKGFALAFGLEHCRADNPDVVMVVDADCTVNANALSDLMRCADHYQTIVQGAYTLVAPEHAKPATRISAFAVFIKNIIRPLGLAKLGGSVPITGSGFAIAGALIDHIDLASGEIVEDMKLGLDLALLGRKVEFVLPAKITSVLPTDNQTSQVQRARWEHGHIGMITKYVPKLLLFSLKELRWASLITALDLCILPFIVLLTLSAGLSIILGSAMYLIGWSVFVYWIVGLNIMLLVALIVANALRGSDRLQLKDVYALSEYALNKIGLYRALTSGKRSRWHKTQRELPAQPPKKK
ncbi:glycosyltransferase family 2 protein [Marinagarivorans algicola]|uniref:glycosyltransferase family 2 protein n=1 Tax=Marinagarivorans algicola TaxID=1513270 RepID=UPI0006B611DD|nr:glycosyltransferase family 2 protein [Marinagarivorans algicola]